MIFSVPTFIQNKSFFEMFKFSAKVAGRDSSLLLSEVMTGITVKVKKSVSVGFQCRVWPIFLFLDTRKSRKNISIIFFYVHYKLYTQLNAVQMLGKMGETCSTYFNLTMVSSAFLNLHFGFSVVISNVFFIVFFKESLLRLRVPMYPSTIYFHTVLWRVN